MKKIILGAAAATLAVVGIGAGTYAYYRNQSDLVYKDVYIEAGTVECSVSDFLKRKEKSAILSPESIYDLRIPGDYDLEIIWEMPFWGRQISKSTLHVQDTIAPEVKLKEKSVEMYTTAASPKAEELVDSIDDVTHCTVEFKDKYDFSKEGEFDAEVVVTDISGNETVEKVHCKVVEDVTPPEILGVKPIEIAQGDAVSYKKDIEVVDDKDDSPTLEVDSSGVNVDKRGTYTLKYIATDKAGNVAEATTTVHVVSAKITEATEETVYGKADEILSEIITDGMTQLQQARAVFDWVVNNITYSETAGIDDVLSAAYKGMYYHVGDCTVKQRTAEVMLNRLGIKNMEIEKIRDTRGHNWLLIDVGEGWYHYDPNLQLDGTLIFYWHDADLWEYSNTHKNTHNYDPSKYPTIQ